MLIMKEFVHQDMLVLLETFCYSRGQFVAQDALSSDRYSNMEWLGPATSFEGDARPHFQINHVHV